MPPKRPTAVKVGPYLYSIIYIDAAVSENGDFSGGITYPRKMEIHVSIKDHCEDYIRGTVWHELKHAILDLVVDDNEGDKTFTGSEGEERFITLVSNLEIGIMRDNPELMAYILPGQQRKRV